MAGGGLVLWLRSCGRMERRGACVVTAPGVEVPSLFIVESLTDNGRGLGTTPLPLGLEVVVFSAADDRMGLMDLECNKGGRKYPGGDARVVIGPNACSAGLLASVLQSLLIASTLLVETWVAISVTVSLVLPHRLCSRNDGKKSGMDQKDA
eukprot:5807405-Ditylum_brightwellii.AAC.1